MYVNACKYLCQSKFRNTHSVKKTELVWSHGDNYYAKYCTLYFITFLIKKQSLDCTGRMTVQIECNASLPRLYKGPPTFKPQPVSGPLQYA